MALPVIVVEVANVILKELLKGMVREVLSPIKQAANIYKGIKNAKKWLDFLKGVKGADKSAWSMLENGVFKEVNNIQKVWDKQIQPLINTITSQNRELGKSVAESIKNDANKFIADKMGLDRVASSKIIKDLTKLVKGQQQALDQSTQAINVQSDIIKAQNEIIKHQQELIEQLMNKVTTACGQEFEKKFVPEKKKELEETKKKIEEGKMNEIIDNVKGTGVSMDETIGDFLPKDKDWKKNFYDDFQGEANNSFLNKILSEIEKHLEAFENIVGPDEWTLLSSDVDSVETLKGVSESDRKELYQKMFGLNPDGSSKRNERTGYRDDSPWAELKSDHYENPEKSAKDLVNEYFLDIMRNYFEDKFPDKADELMDYYMGEALDKD